MTLSRVLVISAGAFIIVSSPVRADAIDGQWCMGASHFEINGPNILTPEAGIEPAAVGAYETPALPAELFRDVIDGCPSWVRTKASEFKARCPTS